ncbi:MAG: YjgN family protein [Bacteroidales bacterium]|nr:YjgN family protein [Bacteroidales bacterium]
METTNTPNTTQVQNHHFQFLGKGSEYFAILIVNWLLTLVTLGFYHPWARAKQLRYTFGHTALNSERFSFSGTGKEMFRGFIKVILFYIIVFVIFYLLWIKVNIFIGILFFYLALLSIVPLAIHGSFRYRMSRTSYRGIRFGYRGDKKWLIKNYIKWTLLTIITLGIYGSWMNMNIRRYTHKNVRYGDVEFNNDCHGSDWFLINFLGLLLTLLTLGIYSFWWEKNRFDYYIDRMSMQKGEQKIWCKSTVTGLGFLKLRVVNFFIIVFTLGFGTAWAAMRSERYIWSNIKMAGNINLDEIHQTEEEYTNTFGDGAAEFFDIDLT